jgi:hypothetical protein
MAEPSYRDAGHLPKRRPGGKPAPPDELPRQRRGATPQMIGRYPDYDVLDHADHWDPVTREVVLARVQDPPPLRFFSDDEARTLGAFLDTVLAQDREPRVPVLHMVDAKLADGRLDGFRYADMPEDPETWRLVARGLDGLADLDDEGRRALVQRFSEGDLGGGVWETLSPTRAWSVVLRAALSAFYSHPWAWNEIGYGGPRYPRGYLRLGAGQEEPDMGAERFSRDPVPDVHRRGLE